MKYIVYITTNKINNKIYVGIHEMEDPNVWDYYLGCGAFSNKPCSYNKAKTPFHAAICKYGVSNFYRHTIAIFDTKKEALNLERIVVNEDFIKRSDTYNIVLGGGAPPVHNKIVYQFDLNGNLLQQWNSLKDVTETLSLGKGGVTTSIKKKKSYNDFYWSFVETINVNEYTNSAKTDIDVYNANGDFLNSFDSIVDAARFYDVNPASISNAIKDCSKLHGLIFCKSDVSIDDFFKKITDRKIVVKTPIYKYDMLSGNFLEKFDSVKDAATKCNLKSHSRIISAAKYGKKSGGYRWSYELKDNILNCSLTSSNKPKQIEQYDLYGNLIKTWDISECRKLYPNCIKVCRGAREKAHGFVWKYKIS